MTLLADKLDIHSLRQQTPRIGVTELAKDTNGWRSKLIKNGIMEITDRNSTAAYLISTESLENILNQFEEQEAAIEELSVASMFDARANTANWKNGAELASEAKASLLARFCNQATMAVKQETLAQAIDAIASISNVKMDSDSLAEDVYLTSCAFAEENEFKKAVSETVRALQQIVQGKITPASLKYSFEGWSSYHFQHSRAQNSRADMRVVFKVDNNDVYVLGFGHRNTPSEIYFRLAEGRL